MSGLLDALLSIVLFVVVLGVLVLFHELGHFITARLSRVRVLEFGFGFPPRAKLLGKRGETEYTLNWLPIGGFVKLEGEDGDSEEPRSFTRAPLWKKLVILVMGVVMNLVLSVVIFGAIAGLFSPYIGVRVGTVVPGSPAETVGIVPGDTVISLDGQMFDIFAAQNITEALRARPGATVAVGVQHADGTRSRVTATLQSAADIAANKGALGFKPDEKSPSVILHETASRPFGEALGIGWSETVRWFGAVAGALGDLGGSIVNHPTQAPPVSGPVGIATTLGDTFRNEGPIFTLYLMGILSANLALVNVLPFPPLDGGRMLMIVLKAIPRFGKKISQRAEQATYAIGFLALFGFLIWVTFFDIARGLTGGGTP
jgi:regulator of sigma E protease